uniref:Uncharacterized protein n=1 Tax=Agrobacterium tumefaciens TaxID=358 RepID=A0A2Z2PTT5_AGRTU|nr:hypothetical protein [Agrobacterium radiobacter]
MTHSMSNCRQQNRRGSALLRTTTIRNQLEFILPIRRGQDAGGQLSSLLAHRHPHQPQAGQGLRREPLPSRDKSRRHPSGRSLLRAAASLIKAYFQQN